MTAAAALDRALLARWPLPDPEEGSKEARGSVAVVGGSREMAGAVLLAGLGALRAGAGRLRVGTAESRAGALAMTLPEAWTFGLPEDPDGAIAAAAAGMLDEQTARGDAVLLGPGMSDGEGTRALVRALLEGGDKPALALDAGALSGLLDVREQVRARGGRVALTPHAGEMAALLGVSRAEVEADPYAAAAHVAEELQAVVAMKGAQTTVVEPGGRAWLYSGGGVGLATSGSGDVLAGVVAGLLARGAAPAQAACWGVFLHGGSGAHLARAVGPLGFLAREIPDAIPRLMAQTAEPS